VLRCHGGFHASPCFDNRVSFGPVQRARSREVFMLWHLIRVNTGTNSNCLARLFVTLEMPAFPREAIS
jgi:hypothetical protein